MADELTEKLMEEVAEEVEALTDDELEAEATRVLAERAKRAEYRKSKTLSEEEKAKRALYRKKKYERDKAIMALALERGLVE